MFYFFKPQHVCLSVRPSVCLSVCLSHYVPTDTAAAVRRYVAKRAEGREGREGRGGSAYFSVVRNAAAAAAAGSGSGSGSAVNRGVGGAVLSTHWPRAWPAIKSILQVLLSSLQTSADTALPVLAQY